MCPQQRLQVVPNDIQMLQCKWHDRFAQWYNLGSNFYEMRKNDQNHRTSVVARANKDRPLALGRGVRSKIHDSLPHQLSTSRGPTLRPLRIWGGEWGQRRVLLLWKN